jgi:DNA polymerase III subunit delta'
MVSPASQSLAFQPLLGQAQAVELLSRAVACDRIAPAYLFVGPEGVGRKLAARLFLEVLLHQPAHKSAHKPAHSRLTQSSVKPPLPLHQATQENHPDLLWVEPTYLHQGKPMTAKVLLEKGVTLPKSRPQVRLEQVRDITRFLSQSPLEAKRLLVVIDGAQSMGESAANGLLKTLEEPGQGTLVLIAQTLDALLPTIVSRCQRIPFHCLSPTDLAQVLHQLGLDHLLNYPQLLAQAQGSPGLAIQYWEKLQTIPSDLLQSVQAIPQSCRACLELAKQIEKALDVDAQVWLLDYLQQHYWLAYGNAALLPPLEKAKAYLASYVQPQLVWEITLLTIMESGGLSPLTR